jgi:hypothetical protein
MKSIIYTSTFISITCLCLYYIFDSLEWPSFLSLLMLAIIFALIFVWSLFFYNFSNTIVRVIISFMAIFLCIMTIHFFKISNIFMTSEPYYLTINALKSNNNIQEVVGTDFEVGRFISGDLTATNAYFNFAIKGNKNKIIVYSRLQKMDDGTWEIIELTTK